MLKSTLLLFTAFFSTSYALNCYQCSGSDSNEPFQCNEWLNDDIDMEPQACDNVYGAKYCIKHIGRFEGCGIKCYQCSASKTLDCSDGLIQMGGIQPESCDNVFEAQYCVKMTSLDGGIGAKRFCSSLDLGNYCNYVRQPGDQLTYRTCVFTCSGDGCNSSSQFSANVIFTYLSTIVCLILTSYQYLPI